MRRKRWFAGACSLVWAMAAFLPCLAAGGAEARVMTGAQDERQRPSFLFILVDDLGWRDLGCYGSTFYETPNLDALAASGVRFTDAYTASPVCSPTRASIMTGKHPARLGITDWIPGQRPGNRKLLGPSIHNELPLEEVTIAERLKAAGYRTFFAGKWHLGGEGFLPEDQGFEINKGGHHKGSPPGGYYAPYNNPKLLDGPEGEYLPDRLTDEAIRFLEMHGQDPFLLYLSFYTVHTPIEACKRHLDRFMAKAKALPEPEGPAQIPEGRGSTKVWQDNPAYASMVHAMDENVGRLIEKLDAMNLSERTVVIFFSDNGGLSTLNREGYPTSNMPLRAGKGWCYEGGIRVPLIIRCPGVTEPGSVCQVPVISTDFYPTLLELAGVKLEADGTPGRDAPDGTGRAGSGPAGRNLDGLSMVPLLRGADRLERDTLYWHFPHYHGSAWTPGAAVRSGDFKLVEFYEDSRVELYHLRNDLGEGGDLAEKMPGKRDELLDMLHAWQKRVGARMPFSNPDHKGDGIK